MSLPTLTIIVPTRNQGQFIEQTLCSILDQAYPRLQLLVVDGGSTDATPYILDQYSRHLTRLSRGCDDPGEAVNAALPYATGELVGVLGSDDLYLPGALAAAGSSWDDAGRPGWLAGPCRTINLYDEPLDQPIAGPPASLHALLTFERGRFPSAGAFFRRDVFDRVGRFATDLGPAFHYELTARLLAEGERAHLTRGCLGAEREHPGSLTATRPLAAGRAHLEAAKRHADQLPMEDQDAFWGHCDERQRIYDAADAAVADGGTPGGRWQAMLRRPAWLGDGRYRRTLLNDAARLDAAMPEPTSVG